MIPQYGARPHDYRSAYQTHRYLTACNKIFENGFLSHRKITERICKSLTIFGMDTSFLLIGMRLLSHMDWGHLLPKNVDSSHGRPGIYYACAFMDSKHSVRISCVATLDTILCPSSGMAVLLRHCSPNSNVQLGEKLDSTNYATARESYLLKRDAHGHQASKAVRGYRDVPLYTREAELNRHW